MPPAAEPLIEGESASLLLAAVLTLRVRERHDGTVLLASDGDPRALASLTRAMRRLSQRLVERGAFETREAWSEAFTIVAQRAMDAYGVTRAPWQLQLAA